MDKILRKKLSTFIKLLVNKLLPAAVEDRFDWFYAQFGLSVAEIFELKTALTDQLIPEERLGRYLVLKTDQAVVMRFNKSTSSLMVTVGDNTKVGSSTYLNLADRSFTWLFRKDDCGAVLLEIVQECD